MWLKIESFAENAYKVLKLITEVAFKKLLARILKFCMIKILILGKIYGTYFLNFRCP